VHTATLATHLKVLELCRQQYYQGIVLVLLCLIRIYL
jgi:hypothetical protein